MFRYLFIFVLGLTAALGQKQTERRTEPRPPATPKTGTPAIVIPAGAVQVTPDVYKHTDSSGTKWIYRKTPFGIVKMKEIVESEAEVSGNPFGDAKGAAANASVALATAVEEGDTVRFERTTPFGPVRWKRKKSELTQWEQETLERSRTQKSGNTGTKE